jgi:nucleoside-diphosphate-sugar epimerase
VIADVLDPSSLDGLPQADRVLYCVGFDRSAGVPIATVYVDGLRHALWRLVDRTNRLVYASSTGVFGGDDGGWVDEATPADPRTESGWACLGGERVIEEEEYAADLNLAATILRFSGLYGPGRIVRRQAIERGEPIAGDPEKILNLIHIDDAAGVSIAALDNVSASRLYLVSDDRPVTRREYYGLVAECLSCPVPQFEPAKPGSPEAARDGSNKRVSNAKMHAELGVTLAYPDITTGVPAALGLKN